MIDAYGWVNVVSPAGLPVRSIVGIRPDPIMFLALNCVDVTKSEEFYAKLGFVRQVGCCMWLTCHFFCTGVPSRLTFDSLATILSHKTTQ